MNRTAFALVVCLALLLPLGCEHSSPTEPAAMPSWLQSLVDQIQREPVTSPPSAIYSYRYRGDTVYFRPSRCCDVPSVLYDANGLILCQPDGGLGGAGDGRCPDFLTTRSDERLIWRDPRGGWREILAGGMRDNSPWDQPCTSSISAAVRDS